LIDYLRKPEGKIFGFGFLIMLLGLVNLFFIRNESFFNSYSFKQLIWIIIAGLIYFIVSRFRLQTLKQISIPFYIITLILLLFVLIFGKLYKGHQHLILGKPNWFQQVQLVLFLTLITFFRDILLIDDHF